MKHMTASNSASVCARSGTIFLPESSQARWLAIGNSKLSEHLSRGGNHTVLANQSLRVRARCVNKRFISL